MAHAFDSQVGQVQGEAVLPRILIVDDRPGNVLALTAALSAFRAEFVTCGSGEEALALIDEREFALILLDLRMPGLNGVQTASYIHEYHPQRKVPIILLTAYPLSQHNLREAYASGVVDVLQKPYPVEVLRSKVSVFLELYEQREQLRQQEARISREEREIFERQLVGVVSHDLRNPLSTILLSSTRMLKRSNLDDAVVESMRRIRNAADRATRLVNELLDFTQARHQGGIPIQPRDCDVHEIAGRVLDELRGEHPQRAIEYRSDGSGESRLDPDRVAQIFSNLVTNALKHGAVDGVVTVRTQGHDDKLRIDVHNQGQPIPSENISRVFEPLQQSMSSRVDAGRGIGLGLFIVSAIVRGHGGHIEVSSSQEQGTTFSVLLPRIAVLPRIVGAGLEDTQGPAESSAHVRLRAS